MKEDENQLQILDAYEWENLDTQEWLWTLVIVPENWELLNEVVQKRT